MRFLFLILFFCVCVVKGQTDKLFLKNGEIKKGIVFSQGTDFVFFKSSDTSSFTQRIPKSEILIFEKYDGKIFIFSKEAKAKDTTGFGNRKIYHHSIGVQPFNFFLGRITASYEYLNKDGSIGFVIPLSLSFDPVGVIYNEQKDSSKTINLHTPGINFVGGADVNFYIGKGDFEGFYLGPRFRYGVNMFLENMEAYSLQTQIGWRLNDPEERLTQHVSVGFGFARILASSAGNRINPKQSYGWFSVNYRIGFNW